MVLPIADRVRVNKIACVFGSLESRSGVQSQAEYMTMLRASKVYDDRSVKIVVVESADIQQLRMPFGVQFFGKLKPVAIIVKSMQGLNAVDLQKKQIDIDDLLRKVPKLAALLDEE